jgi:hypothetical protein
MLILMSLHTLLNTYVSLKTTFSANNKFIQTRSLSLFIAVFVITLTLALVFSIVYVSILLTFTSSFSVFVVYTYLVLCLNLTNLILTVKTLAFVCISTLLKSSFVNIREHTSKF